MKLILILIREIKKIQSLSFVIFVVKNINYAGRNQKTKHR